MQKLDLRAMLLQTLARGMSPRGREGHNHILEEAVLAGSHILGLWGTCASKA